MTSLLIPKPKPNPYSDEIHPDSPPKLMPNNGHDKAYRRRMKTLDFIRAHFAEHHYGPTIREILANTSVTSSSVATYHLNRLEEAGFIERRPDLARGIFLKDPWGLTISPAPPVPVLSDLRRDQPVLQPEPCPLPEDAETVAVLPEVYYRHRLLYALRLTQDWPEALLAQGDLLVCAQPERNRAPVDGSIILAWNPKHSRQELGKLVKMENCWQLRPANPQARVQLIPTPKLTEIAAAAQVIRQSSQNQ